MKSILVTGSNGYIGRHVLPVLTKAGAQVVAVDRTIDESTDADVRIAADIFDGDANILEAIGFVPDACLHLAWRNGFNHNDPSHMNDLSAHFSFLMDLAQAGVKQVAAMGSMHEVGYWEGAIALQSAEPLRYRQKCLARVA